MDLEEKSSFEFAIALGVSYIIIPLAVAVGIFAVGDEIVYRANKKNINQLNRHYTEVSNLPAKPQNEISIDGVVLSIDEDSFILRNDKHNLEVIRCGKESMATRTFHDDYGKIKPLLEKQKGNSVKVFGNLEKNNSFRGRYIEINGQLYSMF